MAINGDEKRPIEGVVWESLRSSLGNGIVADPNAVLCAHPDMFQLLDNDQK